MAPKRAKLIEKSFLAPALAPIGKEDRLEGKP
jgi:hypothetical protein